MYKIVGFLKRAEERYVKILKLNAQFPGQFLVPTYDIDLMWHTHMASPRKYGQDTT